jgi:hypothetical protein
MRILLTGSAGFSGSPLEPQPVRDRPVCLRALAAPA